MAARNIRSREAATTLCSAAAASSWSPVAVGFGTSHVHNDRSSTGGIVATPNIGTLYPVFMMAKLGACLYGGWPATGWLEFAADSRAARIFDRTAGAGCGLRFVSRRPHRTRDPEFEHRLARSASRGSPG